MPLTLMSLILLVTGFIFLAISVILAGKQESDVGRRRTTRTPKRRNGVQKKAA